MVKANSNHSFQPEVTPVADRQLMMSMLEDSGSRKLYCGAGHLKFRLPDNSIFITSSTPSSPMTYTNAVAALRRRLRPSHPTVAEYGRNYTAPKNKRYNGGNTIASMLSSDELLGLGIDPLKAVPGAQENPLPEAEFQIIEALTITEVDDTPRYTPPRKQRQAKEPPAAVRTITAAQLAEANNIMATKGKTAMDAFLDQCCTGMVPVTAALIVERFTPQSHREENEMSHIYDRTVKELEAINLRITTYDTRIAELTELNAKRETDMIKKMQLEEYIEGHKKLAASAAALLEEQILPPESSQPIKLVKGMKGSKRSSNPDIVQLGFNIADVRTKVFPILHAKSETFTMDDVMKVIADCNFPGPVPERKRMMAWISPMCSNAKSEIKSITPGVYGFKVAFESARKTG